MNEKEFINNYLAELALITQQVSQEDIQKAMDLLYTTWRNRQQVFIAGNGGSASTATHFTCDLSKFTNVEGKQRFRVICLNDNIPLVSALTNDLGWDNVYYEQLRNLMNPNDVLVVISVLEAPEQTKQEPGRKHTESCKYVQSKGGKVIV
jgi:D-sedoheptulose 7-phosphate isomerase